MKQTEADTFRWRRGWQGAVEQDRLAQRVDNYATVLAVGQVACDFSAQLLGCFAVEIVGEVGE
jgi:hypothetical protein